MRQTLPGKKTPLNGTILVPATTSVFKTPYSFDEDFSQTLLELDINGDDISHDAPVKFNFLRSSDTHILNIDISDEDYQFYQYQMLQFSGIWNTVDIDADTVIIKNRVWSDVSYKSLLIDNAGGTSAISEALSIEYFIRKYGVSKILYEKEVSYWIEYKMCDFLIVDDGENIGVSVSRAMGYPSASFFKKEDAVTLIKKKIEGLIIARSGVCMKHTFHKSILHIWCQTLQIAKILGSVYKNYINNHPNKNSFHGLRLILTFCEYDMIYNDKSEKKYLNTLL